MRHSKRQQHTLVAVKRQDFRGYHFQDDVLGRLRRQTARQRSSQQLPCRGGQQQHLHPSENGLSVGPPRLEPHDCALTSFVAQYRGDPPEVASPPCVDPIETAADKLSAFT